MASVGHAVVIGGSIAGLLAARALSEFSATVTIVDRDVLPDGAESRKGVPQDRQVHALLARGAATLETLFPGFLDDLVAAGVPSGDVQGDYHWYMDGYQIQPAAAGVIGYGATRPLIESLVRTRVTALANVDIVDGVEAAGLVLDTGRDRVTGVRIVPRDGTGSESVVDADVVVDASGRGSRAGVWLTELGFEPASTTEVRANVVYVTRQYQREPHHLDGRIGSVIVPSPQQRRAGAVVRQEGERFALLLVGMLGDEPPVDDEKMTEFAAGLPDPDLLYIMKNAKPLTGPAKMRYPASVRHHYEKLSRHLDGFLVVGDALCSFNPVYGQGMSVAAIEADLLRKLLNANDLGSLSTRYFHGAAKVINSPWALASSADLRFPEVEGKRTLADKMVNRYLDRYRMAASIDPVLGGIFMRVANLLAPPTRLLGPGAMVRVFRNASRAVPLSATRPGPSAEADGALFVRDHSDH